MKTQLKEFINKLLEEAKKQGQFYSKVKWKEALETVLVKFDLTQMWIRTLKEADILLKYLKGNEKILDFGGGFGRFAKIIADFVDEVVVLDVAEELVNKCRIFCRDKRNVYCMLYNGLDIPYPTDYFDVIVSILVLQHLPKDITKFYLAEFKRVCKKNGIFFIQMPTHIEEYKDHSFLFNFAELIEKIELEDEVNKWKNIYYVLRNVK